MRSSETSVYLYLFLLILASCHPRIYEFNVDPRSIGSNDSVRVDWKVKGTASLRIHNYNYPGSGNGKLPDQTLLITQHGATIPFPLPADSTLQIPLAASEDFLTLRKKPDSNAGDMLRYITLVVTRNRKDSSRVVQVEIRGDSASDEIAFRVIIHGDSLVAAGTNNPARWGDNFYILSVQNPGNHTLNITHSNISDVLPPGNQPDQSFKGTTVKGDWSFTSAMTTEERNDHRLIPNFLKIVITIKHR
jgi:hypothetical protein